MSALRGFNNTVTKSGSYTLYPVVWIAGIASAGGASATFSGSGVVATINTSWSVLNLLSGYSIKSSNGASVTLGTSTNGLISALSGSSLTADGGTLRVGGATIGALTSTSYHISNGGILSITAVQSSAAISALASSSVDFGSGGGTLVIQPGNNLNVISFSSISGFDSGDAIIEIPGATSVTSASDYLGNTSITFDNGLTVIISGNFYDYAKNKNLWQYTDGRNVYIRSTENAPASSSTDSPTATVTPQVRSFALVCYLEGSMIRTSIGETPVEELKVGDRIVTETLNGGRELQRVVWTGAAEARVNRALSDDLAGYPIRIKANAIAENVPYRDLLVTAEHGIFLEDVFVPARMLVNGDTIAYDREVHTYTYYHFETEQHAVVLANGLTSESYLDTGNRSQFTHNSWDESHARSPLRRFWDLDSAAPLCVDREKVEKIFHALRKKTVTEASPEAGFTLPKVTSEPRLNAVTEGGTRLNNRNNIRDWYLFELPAGVKEVSLVSRATRPCDAVGPYLDDRRRLGLLVGRILVLKAKGDHEITEHLTDEALEGWLPIESDQHRWTGGRARVRLGQIDDGTASLLAIKVVSTGLHCLKEQSKVAEPTEIFFNALSQDSTPKSRMSANPV